MLVKANIVAIVLALTATTLAQTTQCPAGTSSRCCVTSVSLGDLNKVADEIPGAALLIEIFVRLGGRLGIKCKASGTSGCSGPCTQPLCCSNTRFDRAGVVAWGCNPPA